MIVQFISFLTKTGNFFQKQVRRYDRDHVPATAMGYKKHCQNTQTERVGKVEER